MKSRFSTTAYLNSVLTVIAVLLLALTLNAYRVPVASSAQAQERQVQFKEPGAAPARPTIDTTNIASTQDLAVASATGEVASANREIAQAIRELAEAVKGLSLGTGASASESPAASSSTGSEPSRSSSGMTPGMVEVGPPAKR